MEKMLIFHKLTCGFDEIPTKISARSFLQTQKTYFKISMKIYSPIVGETILTRIK